MQSENEDDARDARFRKLGNEHASASRRKSSPVLVWIGILHDAALFRVCLERTAGRIDERTRLHCIDGGEARLGVQLSLRVLHHVDTFKRVYFAAYGPGWGLRAEGRPDGALNMRWMRIAFAILWPRRCTLRRLPPTLGGTTNWTTNSPRMGRVTCPRSTRYQRRTDPCWRCVPCCASG